MTIDQKILERVKKLFTLANNDGAFSGEAAAAMKMARKLMDQYNIDEQQVLLTDAGQRTFRDEIVEADTFRRAGSIEAFDASLAWVCVYICDVQFYLIHRWGKSNRGKVGKQQWLVFYGHKKDVAIAQALYKELNISMRVLARHHYGDNIKAVKSFLHGFVHTLIQRAEEEKKVTQAGGSPAGAIVLRKESILEDWFHEKFPQTKAIKRRKNVDVDWHAWCRGSEASKQVSLRTDGLGREEADDCKQLR